MEANELMCNDIVLHHGNVYRVFGIMLHANALDIKPIHLKNTEGLILGPITCFATEVQPIPLTAEILEKNGLLTEQLYGVNHRVYCAEMSIERGMFLFEHRFGGQLDLQMAFEYVHELQHALRLCGLNELADNLKI